MGTLDNPVYTKTYNTAKLKPVVSEQKDVLFGITHRLTGKSQLPQSIFFWRCKNNNAKLHSLLDRTDVNNPGF